MTHENPKPTFEEWKAVTGVCLAADSPYSLESLYKAVIDMEELMLYQDGGELKRYGRVATVDVFYKAAKGERYKLYKLREMRYRIKPERLGGKDQRVAFKEVLGEVLAGDLQGVTPSPDRPAPNSVSERIKLNGESPENATVRALREELFDGILGESREDNFSDLDLVLMENLQFGEPSRVERDAYAYGNSYRGIVSIYDNYPSSITFTPEMHVPVQLIEGVPQPLYEFAEGKYLNLYVWDIIPPESTVPAGRRQ